MKDVAQSGRAGGRSTGRGSGLGLRVPSGARPPRHATTTAATVFAKLAICGDGGATRQPSLSGIWLGLLASASGGAAQSAFMLIPTAEWRITPRKTQGL